MAACFIPLRDDGIDATSFQPERFLYGRRRRNDSATSGLDPSQQVLGRQAKMKAHDFGFCVRYDAAHGFAKRSYVQTGRRRFVVDPKLTIIRRQPIMPSALAASVGFRLGMTEEVDVDRSARQPTQLLNGLRRLLRLHCCATN